MGWAQESEDRRHIGLGKIGLWDGPGVGGHLWFVHLSIWLVVLHPGQGSQGQGQIVE